MHTFLIILLSIGLAIPLWVVWGLIQARTRFRVADSRFQASQACYRRIHEKLDRLRAAGKPVPIDIIPRILMNAPEKIYAIEKELDALVN